MLLIDNPTEQKKSNCNEEIKYHNMARQSRRTTSRNSIQHGIKTRDTNLMQPSTPFYFVHLLLTLLAVTGLVTGSATLPKQTFPTLLTWTKNTEVNDKNLTSLNINTTSLLINESSVNLHETVNTATAFSTSRENHTFTSTPTSYSTPDSGSQLSSMIPANGSDLSSHRVDATRRSDTTRRHSIPRYHHLRSENEQHSSANKRSSGASEPSASGSQRHSRRRSANELQQQKLLRERAAAAHRWAPVAWLHPQEVYYGGDVHTFLAHVNTSFPTRLEQGPAGWVYKMLPTGGDPKHQYLLAPIDTECCNCPVARFLHGEQPLAGIGPPVYVHIHSCLDNQPQDNLLVSRDESNRSMRSQIQTMAHPLPRPPRYRRMQNSHRRGKRGLIENNEVPRAVLTRSIHQLSTNDNPDHGSKPINSEKKNDLLQDKVTKKQRVDKWSKLSEIDPVTNKNISSITKYKSIDFQLKQLTGNKTNDKRNAIHNSLNTDVLSSDHQSLDSINLLSNEEFFHPLTNSNEQNNPELDEISATPGHDFTLTYWFFFPYNRGKAVCTTNVWLLGRVAKPLFYGKCLGHNIVMGNHVGDWEHISIFFKDGVAKHLYISAHNFGAVYTWRSGRWEYKRQDVRDGMPLRASYPQYIELVDGRLELFVAKGSHGLWPIEGSHSYNSAVVPLEDDTAKGDRWDTSHRVQIMDPLDPAVNSLDRQWLGYKGKWGNPSSNCHPGMLGFCELKDGPTGIPTKRINFPCDVPTHDTFPSH